MSEQNPQDKKYVTEWSFSFDRVGESINKLLGSVGVSETEVKHASYSEPVGGALSAAIELGTAVGQINVHALTTDNLFEAELAYVGEIEYAVTGDAEKKIKLGQKMRRISVGDQIKTVMNQISNREDLVWTIGISPTVPVKLELDGGVGVSRLDLSGLRITEVEVDGGVGETFLNLPTTGSRYGVKLDGGVGATHITIADGAALNLKIDAGVGAVDIHLPATAAVRLEGDGGVGGVSVPPSFNRVRGSGSFIGAGGVWETTGFSLAATQIYIHFEGGVGGLKLITE